MAGGVMLPMLATPSTGSSGRAAVDLATLVATGDWVLDTKLDGERVWMHHGRLFNRKGADVTHVWPEIPLGPDWIDGEIVTNDGRFETTLLRSSQSAPHAIKRLAEQHPARLIAFDAPEFADEPWDVRRAVAAEIVGDAMTPIGWTMAFWDRIVEHGMEGVIAKRVASKYRFEKRSLDWIKFKVLHRVSCVAVGYEPGNGHRERFGAMKLALLDERGVATSVGRVGSGFTERDIDGLKTLLDAGQMPVVEIECTHVTSGGVLRFPVYRGQRLDVALIDCTTAQLTTIPKTG